MTETKIHVGLNNRETKEQMFNTEKYISVLKKVCYSYHTPFSLTISEGGYFHENGEYTQEKTLIISLIDADEQIITEIAKDLCVFFDQESVLITVGEVKAYFISEEL